MKLISALRVCLASAVLMFSAAAVGAPMLIVENGILMGAKNVDVGGALYNVDFKKGSCVTLFNGCVNDALILNNAEFARLAGRALMDTVMIDGPDGAFDSDPTKVFGCNATRYQCFMYLPFQEHPELPGWLLMILVSNGDRENLDWVSGSLYRFGINDVVSGGASFYPSFELVEAQAAIPEPSSIALLCIAVAGMGLVRRRAS